MAIAGILTSPAERHRSNGVSLSAIAFVASTIFSLLFFDAVMHDRAFFDASLLKQVQRFDAPFAGSLFGAVNALTSSHGAVAAWAAVLVTAVALRRWVAAMAVAALPVGGAINYVIGMVPDRTRPEGDEFIRTVGTNAASFPSGHVIGAVLLYGLLLVLAGRIRFAPARYAIQAGSAAVVLLVGPARMWEGAHWPSDVLGAYTLGLLLLTGLVALYRRIDLAAGDLPLIRQGAIPHDESTHHVHALTSVVVFDETSVTKFYSPGLLPRVLYWVAFQAKFPYIENTKALEAAAARRNLAGLLTEYWYGENRVARVQGIRVSRGRLGLASDRVHGSEPEDRAEAKAFLKDLSRRFDEAGLPTWQIDPRQPRSIDNALETAPGVYTVIDLESGLVSPLASFRAWRRGVRRGMVPLFDNVSFDITREYVERNAVEMRATLGNTRFVELLDALDLAEEKQAEWHAAEPRLIGRFAGGFWNGWNYKAWPGRVQRLGTKGQARTEAWFEGAINAWQAEGRLSTAEVAELRSQVASPEVRRAMPHLGAHGAISMTLRFPFGSIARAGWTLGALLAATGSLAIRRTSLDEWKASWSMHGPLVILIAGIPGFGTFAYLAAKPVRRNRLLIRVAGDRLGLKVPGRLYERTGMRRIVLGNKHAGRIAQPHGAELFALDPARTPIADGPHQLAA